LFFYRQAYDVGFSLLQKRDQKESKIDIEASSTILAYEMRPFEQVQKTLNLNEQLLYLDSQEVDKYADANEGLKNVVATVCFFLGITYR
jgi:hypothetical protein